METITDFIAPPKLTPSDLLDLALRTQIEFGPIRSEHILAAAQWMESNGIASRRYIGPIQYPFGSSVSALRGKKVTVLKGTRVYGVFTEATRGVIREPGKIPYVIAGRTYKVLVNHVLPGSIYPVDGSFNHTRGTIVRNPSIRWAGPSGYWREVDLNDVPEFNPEPVR